MKYKAYMSYGREADTKLASILKSALQRFARPWYRLRAIQVFRHKTSFPVTPALWSSTEKALDESEYFLLLASPEAAVSQWVQKEIDYWLKNSPADKILIVVTGGELFWDNVRNDFDWTSTTALPPRLKDEFTNEPLYIDLRWARKEGHLSLNHAKFLTAIADIAATLHDKPKDQLAGEDVRQHRKTIRLAWSAVVGLLTLMVIVSASAYYATQQRNKAELRLGDSLMANAVGSGDKGEWLESRELGAAAKELFIKHNRDKFEVDLHIWRTYILAPPPLLSHVSSASMMTFSPNRTHGLAIHGNRAELIDLKTMRVLRNFIESPQEIVSIWFSPKSDGVLVENADHTLTLWDHETRRPIQKLPGHGDRLRSTAISTDGRLVVSTAEDNTTIVWDLRSGKVLHELAKGEQVNAVAFTPDSESVMTGSQSGRITLWNTRSGEKIRSLGKGGVFVLSVAISNDGGYAISGGEAMILWDLKTGKALRRFSDAKAPIWEVAFSNDDRFVLATMGIQEPSVKVWFADTGMLRYTFAGLGLSLQESRFSPHGVGLFHQDEKRKYFSVRLDDRSVVRVQAHDSAITRLEFSPDSQVLVTIDYNGAHEIWDVATGYQLEPLPLNGRRLSRVRFLSGGSKIAYGGVDGKVGIIDLGDGEEIFNFQAHEGGIVFRGQEYGIVDLAISPDGHKALTVGMDMMAKLWRIEGGKLVLSTQLRDVPVNVCFGQGGKAGLIDGLGALTSWDLETGKYDTFADEQRSTGLALAVSRDGKRVCNSRGELFELQSWNLAERQKIRSYTGHSFVVSACDFSPDGAWLVSASYDRTVRFWEVATGRQLPEVRLEDALTSVRFSSDGRHLAVGRSNGELQIWRLWRPSEYETFTPKVAQALATLSKQPKHLESLELLARWYAFREIWTWSSELFEEVRQAGGDVSSLPLARAYWSLGRYDEAGREYQRALERKEAPPYYLRMCQRAVEFYKLRDQEQPQEK